MRQNPKNSRLAQLFEDLEEVLKMAYDKVEESEFIIKNLQTENQKINEMYTKVVKEKSENQQGTAVKSSA